MAQHEGLVIATLEFESGSFHHFPYLPGTGSFWSDHSRRVGRRWIDSLVTSFASLATELASLESTTAGTHAPPAPLASACSQSSGTGSGIA